MADTSSPISATAATPIGPCPRLDYFSTRCQASVEVRRDTFVPCGLKIGHDGPHKPMNLGKQTVSK